MGSNKNPIWRVVVADKRSPRDGRVIETIGRYNAQTEPSTIQIDEERARYWLGHAVVACPGNASSTIPGDCEAGLDRHVPESETPDGRPGAVVQFHVPRFHKDREQRLERGLSLGRAGIARGHAGHEAHRLPAPGNRGDQVIGGGVPVVALEEREHGFVVRDAGARASACAGAAAGASAGVGGAGTGSGLARRPGR